MLKKLSLLVLLAIGAISSCAQTPFDGNPQSGKGTSALAVVLPEASSGTMLIQFENTTGSENNPSFTVDFNNAKLIESGYTVPADTYQIKVSIVDTNGNLKYYGETENPLQVVPNQVNSVNLSLVSASINGTVVIRSKILYSVAGELIDAHGNPASEGITIVAERDGVRLHQTQTINNGTFILLIDSSHLNQSIVVKVSHSGLSAEKNYSLQSENNFITLIANEAISSSSSSQSSASSSSSSEWNILLGKKFTESYKYYLTGIAPTNEHYLTVTFTSNQKAMGYLHALGKDSDGKTVPIGYGYESKYLVSSNHIGSYLNCNFYQDSGFGNTNPAGFVNVFTNGKTYYGIVNRYFTLSDTNIIFNQYIYIGTNTNNSSDVIEINYGAAYSYKQFYRLN